MKKAQLQEAAARAKIEIDDQIDKFIEKLNSSTDDPNNFITMSQLEFEWHQLSLATSKTYSDLVSKALSSFDTKELNRAKKENSSGKESD